MTKRISKYKLLKYYKKDLFGKLRLLEVRVKKFIPNVAIIESLREKASRKKKRLGYLLPSLKPIPKQIKKNLRKYKEIKFNKQRVKEQIDYKRERRLNRTYSKREAFFYRVDIGKPRKKRRKLSLFAKRLFARHKLRFSSSLMSLKTFRRYVSVSKKYNKLFKAFNRFLESRLDFFLNRINFPALSIQHIRQQINHGFILINGTICRLHGYHIKPFDIISVLDKQSIFYYLKNLKKFKVDFHIANIPKYIEINFRIYSAVLLYHPATYEIPMSTFINYNRSVITGKRFKG